jgi:hypothetical protein
MWSCLRFALEEGGGDMKILVACEESQAVTIELRRLGHEAYSCDIEPCSGGHPEWHIQDDVSKYINGYVWIVTQDGVTRAFVYSWDTLLAFPPCTDLASSGARWFPAKIADGRQQRAIEFFMSFVNAKCEHIAIENPIGIMSTVYRKPDQIIQPYEYGEPFEKKTCLWLKGLPKLKPTKIISPPTRKAFKSGKTMPAWYADAWRLPPEERAKVRSKTFPGIAKAMAEQWAGAI